MKPKPPENLQEIRDECNSYRLGTRFPKGLSDWDKMMVHLDHQVFANKAPEYVQVLLKYIDKLEKQVNRKKGGNMN